MLLTDGRPFVQRWFSFLNLWNILFAMIVSMPGLLCLFTADDLTKWQP